MTNETFLLGSGLTLVEGTAYLIVGGLLASRAVRPGDALPARLFVAWWFTISANKILAALAGLGIYAGVINVSSYIAIIYLNIVILAVSLGSLVYYLLYLRTGRTRLLIPVAVFYGAYYAMLTYQIAASHPYDVGIGAWRSFLIGEFESPPGRSLLILVVLFLPLTIAAASLLAVLRGVPERALRYRTSLVAFSVISWSLSILFVSLPRFSDSPAMQVSSRLIGVVAAFMALAAYAPPAMIGKRLAGAHGATRS